MNKGGRTKGQICVRVLYSVRGLERLAYTCCADVSVERGYRKVLDDSQKREPAREMVMIRVSN